MNNNALQRIHPAGLFDVNEVPCVALNAIYRSQLQNQVVIIQLPIVALTSLQKVLRRLVPILQREALAKV